MKYRRKITSEKKESMPVMEEKPKEQGVFIKTLQFDQQFYSVFKDENEWYLIKSTTPYDTETGERISIASPENYRLSWDDVVDVDMINGCFAVICANKDGLLSVNPALGGSGFAIDISYHNLKSSGAWGEYVKINCPSCHKSWYYNQSRFTRGQNYEVLCECGMLLRRKKI